jgi:hypothetical protein
LDIQREKEKYLYSIGKKQGDFSSNPRTDAFYQLGLSLKFDDKESAERYARQYILEHGDIKSLQSSLMAGSVYGGLSKEEMAGFRKWLSGDQMKQLDRANSWYLKNFIGKAKAIVESVKSLENNRGLKK